MLSLLFSVLIGLSPADVDPLPLSTMGRVSQTLRLERASDTAPEPAAPVGAPAPTKLHEALMLAFAAMNATHSGVFHEDVSAVVAPFFPVGQTLADTQRILHEQGFPPLRLFHGSVDRPGETIFVSRQELTVPTYADVAAVLDFTFEGAGPDKLRLEKVGAYLQSTSM